MLVDDIFMEARTIGIADAARHRTDTGANNSANRTADDSTSYRPGACTDCSIALRIRGNRHGEHLARQKKCKFFQYRYPRNFQVWITAYHTV